MNKIDTGSRAGPSKASFMKISSLLSPSVEITPNNNDSSNLKSNSKRKDLKILNVDGNSKGTSNDKQNTIGQDVNNSVPSGVANSSNIIKTTNEVFNPLTNTIDIEIPISTHNGIHSEFNFPMLLEEKYDIGGTEVFKGDKIGQGGAAEIDVDDEEDEEDDDDDDDEEEEEEDEEVAEDDDVVAGEENNASSKKSNTFKDDHAIVKLLGIQFDKEMSDLEKESLVLTALNKREAKNNKRIGKYDVYDPFIDDEELELEEQGGHGDGWFIWKGRLGDLRGSNVAALFEQRKQVPVEVIDDSFIEQEHDSAAVTKEKSKKITMANEEAPKKRLSRNHENVVEADVPVKKQKRVRLQAEPVTAKEKESPVPAPSTPIIKNGPVVASSNTSTNKIIIGSFTPFT